MSAVFIVLSPGPLTTVQDMGRNGRRYLGVPVSGALDTDALRVANILVGNPQGSAVLECTLVGPRLQALRDADVALTGAETAATVNHKPVPNGCSFYLRAGDILDVGRVTKGCRSYLAVRGGFDVPVVLGSRSTYLAGGFGGLEGRRLMNADVLNAFDAEPLEEQRALPSGWSAASGPEGGLRAIPGPQAEVFREATRTFFSAVYEVDYQSDRMGCRLNGPAVAGQGPSAKGIISEPVMTGAVQVPADGRPIILLVEQTVGGYAKIATVISADRWRLAQAVPGDRVCFKPVGFQSARRLLFEKESAIAALAATFGARHLQCI